MPELERKPGGLTALGVLCVLFGAGWVIAAAWGLLQPQVHAATLKRTGAPELLVGIGLAGAYIQAAGTLLLGGLMFAAGIGLLRLRRWGARLARTYAVGQLVLSAAGALLALAGPMSNRPPADTLPKEYADVLEHDLVAISITEIVAGFALSAVFAVVLLCLLTRKRYVDLLK